MLPKVQQQ
uniref:Uncharacterized protein n=1 Tax=Anguilla anguilla TaxID=7936 RepID=A0A0E9QGK2_ANGAN